MNDYLDRLEHELVSAIDRRAGAGRRRRLWRRTRALLPVNRVTAGAAAAALALAALVALLVLPRSADVPPTPGPTPTAPARPAPLPAGTPLRISGDVVRETPSLWRGAADGPGGRGELTIAGRVAFVDRSRQTVRFSWVSDRGSLEGCADVTILRRPGGRWVWDAPASITSATGALRRFAGSDTDFAGRTPVSDTSRAHIGIHVVSRPPPDC